MFTLPIIITLSSYLSKAVFKQEDSSLKNGSRLEASGGRKMLKIAHLFLQIISFEQMISILGLSKVETLATDPFANTLHQALIKFILITTNWFLVVNYKRSQF